MLDRQVISRIISRTTGLRKMKFEKLIGLKWGLQKVLNPFLGRGDTQPKGSIFVCPYALLELLRLWN